jgi:uncharacterized protein (UPF0332 family)
MKSSDIQALIAYRMEKSMEAIKAAEIMLENNMLTFAMNRIYYSMFYAVQSLLASDGVSFSKHGQVKGYFNRKWIKSGKFSKTLGQLYNKAFEYRQKFDYVDFAAPKRDMVAEYIQKANEFYNEIDEFLRNETQTNH